MREWFLEKICIQRVREQPGERVQDNLIAVASKYIATALHEALDFDVIRISVVGGHVAPPSKRSREGDHRGWNRERYSLDDPRSLPSREHLAGCVQP
jgi:hypothetical protein